MTGDVISWSSIEGLEKAMGKDAAHAFARRLCGFFEEKVTELEKVFESGDNEALRNCIHKTASNAAALGALQLTQQMRAMEADCQAGRWEKVRAERETALELARKSLIILKERLG